MGRPKATLPFGPTTMLERLVEEIRRFFADIVVVAAPERVSEPEIAALEVTAVRDTVAFAGPVRALMTGLRSVRSEVVFACACDLPLLRAEVAMRLCSMLGDHDAVIPLVDGRFQTLHAAYRRRCADTLEAMCKRGERRLDALLPLLRVRVVEEAELRPLDPGLRSFTNINTPRDYKRALELFRRGC